MFCIIVLNMLLCFRDRRLEKRHAGMGNEHNSQQRNNSSKFPQKVFAQVDGRKMKFTQPEPPPPPPPYIIY